MKIILGRMYKTYMNYLPSNGRKKNKVFIKLSQKLLTEVGNEFNVSYTTIKNYVSLLDLPKELGNLIETMLKNIPKNSNSSESEKIAEISNNYI